MSLGAALVGRLPSYIAEAVFCAIVGGVFIHAAGTKWRVLTKVKSWPAHVGTSVLAAAALLVILRPTSSSLSGYVGLTAFPVVVGMLTNAFGSKEHDGARGG